MAEGRKTGGRKAGTPNKSTPLRDVLNKLCFCDASGRVGNVDLHVKRLQELTQSKDEHIAMKALTLALAYRHGRAPETINIGSDADRPVLVRFVDAAGA